MAWRLSEQDVLHAIQSAGERGLQRAEVAQAVGRGESAVRVHIRRLRGKGKVEALRRGPKMFFRDRHCLGAAMRRVDYLPGVTEHV